MLAESVLGRLYAIWLQSAIFAALGRFSRFVGRCWRGSLLRRALAHESRIQQMYETGLFARVVAAVLGFIVSVLRRIFSWFGRLNAGSVNLRLWRRYGSGAFLLRYESIFGAFLCVMFLWPHDYWSNTYALLGAAVILVLYFCMVARSRRSLLQPTALGLPALLFAAACCLSLAFTRDMSDSIRVLLFFVTGFMLCYLAAGAANSRRSLMTVLGFIYLGVFLTGCYAIVQRIMGVEVSSSLTDLTINEGVPGRVYAGLDNPNNYAEFLVLMLPVSAAYAINVRAKWGNLPLSLPLCLGLAVPMLGIVMTYSRSGWISIALAALVFVFFAEKKLIPILFMLAVLCVPLLPDSVITRFLTLFNNSDSSNNHRLLVWQGVSQLLGDYWKTGIGLGPNSFAEVYPTYARPAALEGTPHSHMVWMELVVETGIFGFVTFMWFYIRTVKNAGLAILGTKNKALKIALCACTAALCGIAFSCCVEYVWYYPRVLFAFFLQMGFCIGLAKLRHEDVLPPEEPSC
ncbi:MAG: O-antigen ligase family protein [Oscillospiraceae bacterium]|nr:O-antigen ligase family protein [Oscillospiraceae bacterium]